MHGEPVTNTRHSSFIFVCQLIQSGPSVLGVSQVVVKILFAFKLFKLEVSIWEECLVFCPVSSRAYIVFLSLRFLFSLCLNFFFAFTYILLLNYELFKHFFLLQK